MDIMFKKSCQILVYKGEKKLPWKTFRQFGYTLRSTIGDSGASPCATGASVELHT